jgi:hypothetical protein
VCVCVCVRARVCVCMCEYACEGKGWFRGFVGKKKKEKATLHVPNLYWRSLECDSQEQNKKQ